jgi:hypothetical protein
MGLKDPESKAYFSRFSKRQKQAGRTLALDVFSDRFPALTHWADLCRASGARILGHDVSCAYGAAGFILAETRGCGGGRGGFRGGGSEWSGVC